MHTLIPLITSSGICTLACRNSLRKSDQPSTLSDILPAQGRILFDLVLTLASGAATWFDLTSGKYHIAIHPSQPSSKIQVLPFSGGAEPLSPQEWLTDEGGDVVNLEQQTRLTIKNPAKGGEPETVAVRIIRMAC